MKFAIYGTGAVGGFLGARLLEAGHEVHFIARGPNLEALRKNGLAVHSPVFGDRRYDVSAAASAHDIGPSDYVVLGVKANALSQVAPLTEPLKGPGTTFVSTQNGLPWWYSLTGPGQDEPIESVDPGGVIARHIAARSVVCSIVYFSCSLSSPGEVVHTTGVRLPLGEPAGGRSKRVLALSEALRAGGIKAPVRNDIRHELWVKLLGNAALNPLTALTQTTLAELVESKVGFRLVASVMDEIREVASAAGVQIALSNERRIDGVRSAGQHRTSMLQDLDRGREPELEALVGSVLELAERNHVEAPTLRAVYAATKVLFSKRSKSEASESRKAP